MTLAVTATDTAPVDSSGHHYAALDGLRGIAVLLVFCVHAAGNSAFVVLGANFEQTRFALLTTAFDRGAAPSNSTMAICGLRTPSPM